ncbi:hypothetical protein [Luteolibacter sp. Populi]|uniref:hypothetical protein n=1 Tax=Luteolibacter sp. Populi TaxID=3230487 RepID=UPI003467A066
MKPGYLWLLLPLAAWSGYKTAPPKVAQAVSAKKEPAAAPDPAVATWASQLEKANVADLEKQFLELLAHPDSPDGPDRMNLLCARWAELDPAGALAFFKANKDPGSARQRLLAQWALLDSEAAWAAIPPGQERDYDREAVMRMLLNEDRGIFMQWFRKNPAVIPDDDLAWTLLAESHGKELEQIAKTLLEKAAPGDGPSYGAGKFFALLAKSKAARDPAAACQWAAGLDPRVRDGALHAALQQWSESDPQEIWKRLNSDDPLLGSYKKTGSHGDSLGGRSSSALLGRTRCWPCR